MQKLFTVKLVILQQHGVLALMQGLEWKKITGALALLQKMLLLLLMHGHFNFTEKKKRFYISPKMIFR